MASTPRTARRSRALWIAVVTALVAGLFAGPVSARPRQDPAMNNSGQLRQDVTLAGVRRHQLAFQQIAEAAGGNRFAGLAGHTNSAQYVFDELTAAGYQPTYHSFSYDAFFERTPSQLEQLSPNATTYVNGNDFRVMTYSGTGTATAAVTALPADKLGCDPADFSGFPAGNIALVSRGACTFRIKTTNAAAAGASAILVYNNGPGVLNGTLGEAGGLSAIPSLGLTQVLGQQLLSTSGLQMSVTTDTATESLTTMNVLAETPTGDPNKVVMVGAHLDSVTTGPGINDNGSGSAAILETAIQMADLTVPNKVRFAWWSAEESGLVGATRYVNELPQAELDKIALYLNFDMIGSPNFIRGVYDGDNSGGGGSVGPAGSAAIEQMFVDYFTKVGLANEPTPFNGRSDYGPFIAKGVPAGGLFTGAEGIKTEAQAAAYGGTAGVAYDPCYHAACDTYENNSDEGLDQMSDAVAHSVITYAHGVTSVTGGHGKGGAPRTGTITSGTGTGGGGLHDDDHEAVES